MKGFGSTGDWAEQWIPLGESLGVLEHEHS